MTRRVGPWLVLAVLLVPAVVLTVARLGDPPWVLVVQYAAFTPFAMLLYAAALVVLLLAAARMAAGRARWATWVGTVLVGAALALHVAWFAPQLVGAQADPPRGATPLRVMTANLLRGDGRVADVLDAAREDRTDVVVLPEATRATERALDRLDADATWPHRAGRAGRDIEGNLVLSRYPLRDERQLGTRLDSLSFTLAAPGGPVRMVAVHPIAPYEGARRWREDHRLILDAVRRTEPDVVLGDFNATMDHAPMRRLHDEGLRTATEVANEGWRPTWPVNGLFSLGPVPLPRSAEIDHVLVSDRVAVLGTERHDVAGSDHLALAADLRLG
ncbi:endonuclease/exonuclease/phosphatase family protein [Nocardioides sp. CFH 31398]|uniref:endonuclease/exonuclease/phosphatase family protein n=1 Tax=Nocardioides sp. CFH 31398 TaxID=2919579 RepID=UPI001F063268|nr:endonuclease/exonuclease/phosphatase family protein [Nocardioides sp. CFH 31398]MCH1867252.1 endonuclease/exonuclease/phosphatase family protein [Nocardioides sp. CFH 31398]